MMNQNKWIGVISGVAAALLWGGWVPVSKYGVSNTLMMSDILFLRFSTASLIALPFLFKYGFLTADKSLFKILALVFCSGLGYVSICFLAFTYTPASFGLIIYVCITFFSIVFAHFFYPEKSIKPTILGLVLILIGFGVFIEEISQSQTASYFGIALFVFAGFIFAALNLATKRWNISSIHAVSLISFYSFLILIPFYFFTDNNLMHASTHEIVFQIIYQGILISFIGLFLFNFTSVQLGQATGALFVVITPVSAVFFSAWFLGETISSGIQMAMSIMVAGMLISLIFARKKALPKI